MGELTLLQRLRLRLFGSVPVGYQREPGWSAPIMHYAFRCPVHGLIVDYRHGFRESLYCLKCWKESWKKRMAK